VGCCVEALLGLVVVCTDGELADTFGDVALCEGLVDCVGSKCT
jgi:hypothetical protein